MLELTWFPWGYVGLIWLYCLVWVVIEDWAKVRIYNNFLQASPRHRGFLHLAAHSLGGFGPSAKSSARGRGRDAEPHSRH